MARTGASIRTRRAALLMVEELDCLADRGGRIEDRLGDDPNEPPSGHYRRAPRDCTFRKLSEPAASDRMQRSLGTVPVDQMFVSTAITTSAAAAPLDRDTPRALRCC